MIDRRTQAMSWLEGLAQDDWPMYHSDSEVQEIAKTALALLEEQKAIKPSTRDGANGFGFVWTCGACGKDLHPNNKKAKYCSCCGQEVKWQ